MPRYDGRVTRVPSHSTSPSQRQQQQHTVAPAVPAGNRTHVGNLFNLKGARHATSIFQHLHMLEPGTAHRNGPSSRDCIRWSRTRTEKMKCKHAARARTFPAGQVSAIPRGSRGHNVIWHKTKVTQSTPSTCAGTRNAGSKAWFANVRICRYALFA